jgi:hypothetical protein
MNRYIIKAHPVFLPKKNRALVPQGECRTTSIVTVHTWGEGTIRKPYLPILQVGTSAISQNMSCLPTGTIKKNIVFLKITLPAHSLRTGRKFAQPDLKIISFVAPQDFS